MSEPKPVDNYTAGEEELTVEETQEVRLFVTKLAVRPELSRGQYRNSNAGTAYVELIPAEPWPITALVPAFLKESPIGIAIVLANQFGEIMAQLSPLLEPEEEQLDEGFA